MNTILVPLDFSDVTPRVIEVAEKMAQATGGRILLLYVHPPEPPLVAYDAVPINMPFDPEVDIESERRQLQEWQERLAGEQFDVATLHMQGPPVDQILAAAVEQQAGMIVMGSHGHGAVFDLLVGSVTHGVLRHAKCPVTVVPAERGR